MKILNWFKKEKNFLIASLILGSLITGIILHYTKAYSETIQTGIAEYVIRFHVIANSDSEEDQELKKEVRDAILKEMSPILSDSSSIEGSRKLLIENMDKMKAIAEEVVKKWGKSYPVKVALGPAVFPTKQYGDIVLPTGEYEALKVTIGKGEGKNWWCVMFPPLCFVDVTHGVVPEETKEELKSVLGDEEYRLVTRASYEEDIPIKIKLKIVEWWQERKEDKKHQFVKKEL
ncbi:MAG: stage sporulation protein [Epulopiscium sp.]|jgi:stage II sporulation protein R|uniref:Stage II sporulation protein R n=1 Tax=Defluviitalea raffinosedens TaxID=1450156 RepID=A0A7C8HFM2_9FIRM|nr:stage II sporulation protein R [Defluviitalea raffinosedens]MBZ4666857.1 stage sporulation protein [Defluviitaleaceae bacterium]MDK2786966.1 stage sporulation protein [Candidatus Epulonipiscium sp.]KAE9636083.1 stage II sporulation protein R [Defluviitalea raffinosedens]MBM7685072.1 stage II sporulation protein R [Defluviitalea raffinosedens]HHW67464.1 stage II sporulation protein R [Candidatus Epulonipiscium sp.]